MLRLMYAPASPFVRKAWIAAIELGLDGEVELVPTRVQPGDPNRAYGREVNPLRKIPALVTEDAGTLLDSTVIAEYLDARAGGGRLIPVSGPGRWRALSRHALADGMTEAAVLLRYETALRPEEARWQVWIDDHWGRVMDGLAHLEAAPPRPGADLDLGDLALGCLLGYLDFRFPDCGWRERAPRIAAWSEAVLARPSFVRSDPAKAA